MTLLQVIGISAVVSGAVTAAAQFFFNRRAFDYQLRRQHEHEERKKLRELISRYQGRMLEAALDWDRRMNQLYDGSYHDLRPKPAERLGSREYYFQSVVFRFLQLMAISRRFEAQAFYIDKNIAEASDFDLLRYAKAFLWVMIHAEITPQDGVPGIDHFRSDAFRPLLDLCYAQRHELPETRSESNELIFDRHRCMVLLRQSEKLGQGDEVRELLDFFDGVRPDDAEYENEQNLVGERRRRRRWDRLVTLDLFALAFISKCGYRWQRDVEERTDLSVQMLLYPEELLDQLKAWLEQLGLDKQPQFQRIQDAVDREAGRLKPLEETPAMRCDRVLSITEKRRTDKSAHSPA